jgi:hypothetical protein
MQIKLRAAAKSVEFRAAVIVDRGDVINLPQDRVDHDEAIIRTR